MSTCIENDIFQIHIDETEGCNIQACFIKRDDELLPLMPDVRVADCALRASSFIMMPYSNRIEDGLFTFDGKKHTLQRGDKHSIHGDVRQRPWAVSATAEDCVQASISTTDFSDINWPWDFTGTARFVVNDHCFRSSLSLRNDSDTAMPAGFGWHPYFSRFLTDADLVVGDGTDAGVCMQVNVDGVYPDANDNRIPSGPARALLPEENFHKQADLRQGFLLDGCFTGYDGCGSLHWPASGVSAHFSCSDECSHVVLFTPCGEEFLGMEKYIAFEPVTNANNGVNLLAAGDAAAGTVILQPGEELTAFMDITVSL